MTADAQVPGTSGPPQRPPFDMGNELLTETPANLDVSLLEIAQGQRLGVTIRTTSATLTVMLAKADAAAWSKLLADSAAQMSGSGLVVASG